MERSSFIKYVSPLTQTVQRRLPQRRFDAVTDFLRECTDWDGVIPESELSLFPIHEFAPDGWDDAQPRREVTERLGPPSSGIGMERFDPEAGQSIAESYGLRIWNVAQDQFQWAADFAIRQPPAKPDHPDAATLNFSVDFRLKDPKTQSAFPGQDFKEFGWSQSSSMRVGFASGKAELDLTLRFPFEAADDDFLEYLLWLKPRLPCRIAKRCFRKMVPNKSNPQYRTRKIPKEFFASL